MLRGGLRVLATAALLMSIAYPCLLHAAGPGKDQHHAALKALQSGEAQKAVELFSKAIEKDPREFRYYNDRGIAYRRVGNMEAALADYTKALELKPDYTNALNNRGIAYLQQGRYNEAAADFTEALKHGGLEGKIYTNRGMARAGKGDHKGAIEDFEKALSFPPVDTRSFLLMAESLEEAGAKEKALKMYQLAQGLATDRDTAARIEKKITALDGAGSRAKQSVEASSLRKAPQSRNVVPAPPPPRAGTGAREASEPAQDTRVESLTDLNGQVRKRAGEKYSSVAKEIYRQGLQFMEKSDATKALVRFEDSRQLERRRKNYYAVAWSDLEIGRSYAAMHEYLKAAPYIEEALRIFEKLKAGDESVLALVELAGVNKATGRTATSVELYKRAGRKAAALGHYALSRIMDDMAAGRPVKSMVSRNEQGTAEGSNPSALPKPEKTVAAHSGGAAGPAGQPHRAGRKTLQWGKKGTTAKAPVKAPGSAVGRPEEEAQPARIILWAKSPSGPKQHPDGKREGSSRQKSSMPEAMVGTAPGAGLKKTASVPATEGTVAQDLQLLRELKSKNAEARMIPVLERLANKYARTRQYDKALYSLTASLALREKLLVGKGYDRALAQAAMIKEQLGRSAEALEDMTRGLALARAKRERTEKELEARSRKLAATLGLDPVKALAAFDNLWKARDSEKSNEETEALHAIGSLFEAADRPTEALKYLNRSSASMMADKARAYRKAGKTQEAERLEDQALQTFKELDYSRYTQMMRKAKAPNPVSRH